MNVLRTTSRYALTLLKWAVLSAFLGVVGGIVGATFHHTLHYVTHLREGNKWLLYLLPVGGLAIVGIYRLCKLQKNKGTNEVIDAVLQCRAVSFLITPAIFLSSVITHLLGGSAGREGAALQLGGSLASTLGHAVKLQEKERSTVIMCGMSAMFAGLFGTPLAACFFTLEFISVGTILSPALLPCYLSAYLASQISLFFGVHAETFKLTQVLQITWSNAWKIVLLAILLSVLGVLMCKLFHEVEHLSKKLLPNPWLRIFSGGFLIVAMTLLVGDQRYNGAGMNMALLAVSGQADWYDFLLKMTFTAITLCAGFKGGEIVPTFCIGATFGCLLGSLLGIDSGMAAALGLVGLFCSVTNSPISSIILSIEMFGSANIHLFALICMISFLLSGKCSLYASQLIPYSKLPSE